MDCVIQVLKAAIYWNTFRNADYISEKNKNINFIIPVSPTTNKDEYLLYQSDKNPSQSIKIKNT